MITGTTNRTEQSIPLSAAYLVGALGLVLVAYLVGVLLAGSSWNPTLFIKFDEVTPALQEYGELRFDEIVYAGGEGHDGKFFFIQASDPFYLEPDENAHLLDRPAYRAQRMLYPTLAGGFGLFPPNLTAWSLLIANVVAVGVGTFLTARVAETLGLSPLFGLAFVVNPAVFVSAVIDTAEVFAMTFLMAAILMVIRRRHLGAAAFFALSALSKETMLVCVVGWIVYELFETRKLRWEMSIPFLAVGAWWLYLRVRLGHLPSGGIEPLGAPFEGFIGAVPDWLIEPALANDFAIALALGFISLFLLVQGLLRRSLIPLLGAGFSLLAIVMVREVWLSYFDVTRGLTPLVTLFFLALPFSFKPHPDRLA